MWRGVNQRVGLRPGTVNTVGIFKLVEPNGEGLGRATRSTQSTTPALHTGTTSRLGRGGPGSVSRSDDYPQTHIWRAERFFASVEARREARLFGIDNLVVHGKVQA